MAQFLRRGEAASPRGPEVLADQRRDTRLKRSFHDPRGNKMNVGVHGSWCRDEALAGNDRCPAAGDNLHSVDIVGVACPADSVDTSALDADGRLQDAEKRVMEDDIPNNQSQVSGSGAAFM